jgi:molybdate transport system ATP-binding protein
MRLRISLHAVGVQRGRKWVLRDLTLDARPGQRCALLGANGAGKTQLLKLLAGDVWPTPTAAGRRTYHLGRQPVDLIEAKSRIAYLGAEMQDKYARYGWDLSVSDLIATGLHRTDLLLSPVTPSERRKIEATLRACGLQRLARQRMSALSYGQKRLALLARALCPDPDWLLLDELYNGLDASYRRRIDRVLRGVRARGGSWIVAAHRACDVPRGTRGLIELDAGRLGAMRPLRREAAARLRAAAGESAVSGRGAPGGVRAGRAARAGRGGARCGPPLVRISRADLYVDYKPVLRGVSWELRDGEHWAVFGANGAGKSSFLKLLYGDLSPALGGVIERRGFPQGTPIADWKRSVGVVSPELQTDYAVNVSVRDLVASGPRASIGLAEPTTAAEARVAARWLKFFGLSDVAERRPRELSYGQLRRALLARALAAAPRLLLLDEPLTGLDPAQRAFMKQLLERLMRRVTLVIAVHHAEDLPRGVTHALYLEAGRAHANQVHSANQVGGSRGKLRDTPRTGFWHGV